MTKASYTHSLLMLFLVITASWLGSLNQKTEHYAESQVVTKAVSIPLWKGTKEERALSSQV